VQLSHVWLCVMLRADCAMFANSSHKCKHYFLTYKYYKCHLRHVRLALAERLNRWVKAKRVFLTEDRCKRICLKAKAYHVFFCNKILILINQCIHFIFFVWSIHINDGLTSGSESRETNDKYKRNDSQSSKISEFRVNANARTIDDINGIVLAKMVVLQLHVA